MAQEEIHSPSSSPSRDDLGSSNLLSVPSNNCLENKKRGAAAAGATTTQQAWRSTCVDVRWCSRKFEEAGLLFDDRSFEVQYLDETKNKSPLAIVVLFLVFTLLVLGLIADEFFLALSKTTLAGDTILVSADSFVGPVTATSLGLALSVVGLAVAAVSCCCHRRRGSNTTMRYKLVASAVWIAALAIPFAYYDVVLLVDLPDSSVDFAVALANSSRMQGGSNISEVADQARGLGFGECAPFVSLLAVMWVLQKVIVVANAVAARLFFAIVPLNAVLLLAVGATGVVNIFVYWTGADCSVVLGHGFLATSFEASIAILAASGALLWTVVHKEVADRELFYWTRKMHVNIATLEKEANPFHPTHLLEWFETKDNETGSSSSNNDRQTATTKQHRLRDSTDNLFWAIQEQDLQLQDRIAAGGSGAVWRAEYRGRAVAAKQIYSNAIDATDVEELAHEAAMLGQLVHPHVVKFLGLCKKPQHSMFIVQEFCDSDLRAFLEAKGWEEEDHEHGNHTRVGVGVGVAVWRLAEELASGMAYLHSREMVHRDLKPENVLLTSDQHVRIADFGRSSQRGATFSTPVVTEATLRAAAGTKEYMAPETYMQFLNRNRETESNATPAVDVYAFGVILWELFHTGKGGAIDELQQLRQYSPSLLATLPCTLKTTKRLLVSTGGRLESPLASRSWSNSATPLVARQLPAPNTKTGSQTHTAAARFRIRDDRHHGTGTVTFLPCSTNRSCWVRFWSQRHLLFASIAAERAFDTYCRSDGFYRMLRWPYVALCVAYVAYAIGSTVSCEVGDVSCTSACAVPLTSAMLYGGTAVLGWWHRARRYSNFVVVPLAFVRLVCSAVVAIGSGWWVDFSSKSTPAVLTSSNDGANYLSPNSTWSYGYLLNATNTSALADGTQYCLGEIQLPASAERRFEGSISIPASVSTGVNIFAALTSQFQYGYAEFALQYGLFFFDALTIPVTLLILGIPFRFYVLLVLIPAATIVAKLVSLVVLSQILVTAFVGNAMVVLLACAAGLVYTSCIVTVFRQERSKRTLFTLYCSLQSEEAKLSRDALFRRYREVLEANRKTFAAHTTRPRPRETSMHVMRAATIN